MAATDVLRAHNILMPSAPAHRRAGGGSDSHPGASRRRAPPAGTSSSSPAAGRRHRGGRKARPAVAEVYAGPAFSTSPDPSSLPLPQFSTRKAVAAVDAAATRNLRLILRLE